MDKYHFYELTEENKLSFLCSYTCDEETAQGLLKHFKKENPELSFELRKQILHKEEEIDKHKVPRV